MKNVIFFDSVTVVTPKLIKLQERSRNAHKVENNVICINFIAVNQYDSIKTIRTKHIELRKQRSKLRTKIILNNAFKIVKN